MHFLNGVGKDEALFPDSYVSCYSPPVAPFGLPLKASYLAPLVSQSLSSLNSARRALDSKKSLAAFAYPLPARCTS